MNQASWLPNLITEDKDEDLVQLVLHSLNHDKKMIRAFAVALLENNADQEVARDINDILRFRYLGKALDQEDETLDPRGL